MGFGGVTALGCTIGQGLSGVSTLALGSFLAVGAIILGLTNTPEFSMRAFTDNPLHGATL